jgi:hypothetical protein
MEPLRTVFTDSYVVDCPHACENRVRVDVMRERGGRVIDIRIAHVTEKPASYIGSTSWPVDSPSTPVAKSYR